MGRITKSGFKIVGTPMGRKRWWQGGLVELLVLCILHHAVVLTDGDVGEYD